MIDHEVTRSAGAHHLPLRAVSIDDRFWAPLRELVRTQTLPQQERQLREGGHIDALDLRWRPGEDNEPHIFWESDIGKWIEAASYSLAKHPDSVLESSVDDVIRRLASAQQPDGYLNIYFSVVRPEGRFTDLRDAHELYCAGHLIEAGVAHFDATGKTTLLEIVQRYADLIVRELRPGGAIEGGYDGHQEIELALMRLSSATGDQSYRVAAQRMLDARGVQPYYFEDEAKRRGDDGYFGSLFPQRVREGARFREYNQSHQPVRDQTDAVGHSVRAMYMYSAMTDYAAHADDGVLWNALSNLWDSATGRKMYVTGGIGSDPSIEGFGADFDLSLENAYAETCAAVGLVLWSQRMALATGDGRYVDVMERALYNGVLAGASADGTHYFYGNPMTSRGDDSRNEWFGVACCPPNFARLVQSLEYYAYAQTEDAAFINLFVSGTADLELAAGHVRLEVESDYPWDGTVRVTVVQAPQAEFELAIRIPGWAGSPVVSVNDQRTDASIDRGFLHLRRDWRRGDVVTLDIPMEPRRIYGDSRLSDTAGRVALARGPLVYCFEGVDNDGDVALLSLPRDARLSTRWDSERGLTLITGHGIRRSDDGPDDLYRKTRPGIRPVEIVAEPYYSWANRGKTTMEIWIREPE